ncbi:hypothetical protein IWZ00DRAFT_265354 [Phyllosticta capitalensis]|uniref:uncharacterized protein n=1 Tax=Phyllosticta capitalensis TaxID=121624 RepID=UPI00313087F2
MSDADGDSTMHSSPRSSVSDDLFPGADSTNSAAAGAGMANTLHPAEGSAISASNTSSIAGGVPLPSTPAANIVKTGELSPPNSQGAPALPGGGSSASTTTTAMDVAAAGAGVQDATTINANGKRVYHTANTGAALEAKGKAALDPPNTDVSIGGGIMVEGGGSSDAAGNSSNKPLVPSVHAASGYRWEREADAPGWAWKNKKAQEDWFKAEETFVDRDRMVKARYGDPLARDAAAAGGGAQQLNQNQQQQQQQPV